MKIKILIIICLMVLFNGCKGITSNESAPKVNNLVTYNLASTVQAKRVIDMQYQYVLSKDSCLTLGVSDYQNWFDDLKIHLWSIALGVKGYWNLKAPNGGYIYAYTGYSNGYVKIDYNDTHDRVPNWIYGVGVGLTSVEYIPKLKSTLVFDISLGIIGGGEEEKWVSNDGHSLKSNRIDPEMKICFGIAF